MRRQKRYEQQIERDLRPIRCGTCGDEYPSAFLVKHAHACYIAQLVVERLTRADTNAQPPRPTPP